MSQRAPRALWGAATLAAAVCVATSPARADDAFTLSRTPIAATDAWKSHVLADDATTLKPAKVTATGNVTNAQALVNGTGTATLTNVAGQAPPMLVLDY